MLFSQVSLSVMAQQEQDTGWQQLNALMEQNLSQLGGRAVMQVWKNGRLQYNKTFNELTKRQEMLGKQLAKRQGKDADELLADFDANTRQRIASSSKWLSAALVMTFVDDGSLNLDDTIGRFLPVMTRNGKGHIKIWHCLSHLTGIHQAGIADKLEERKIANAPAGSTVSKRGTLRNAGETRSRSDQFRDMDAAMDSIANMPMEGEPGKTFHYGNAGLQIAAAIIEKISLQPFNELFIERIAKPLGMSQTDFGNAAVPLAAGGAYSTPNDYMKFLVMMLQKGRYQGKQIISEASVSAMQVNRILKDVKVIYSPAEAGDWGYGFGAWVSRSSSALPNRDGGDASSFVTSPGLFGSFPWIDHEKQYAAFLFVLNLKHKGRHDLYRDLKKAVDSGLIIAR